jgi:hypothetical protein
MEMAAKGMQLQPSKRRNVFGIILLITAAVLLALHVDIRGHILPHHIQHAWTAKTAYPVPQDIRIASNGSHPNAATAAAAGAANDGSDHNVAAAARAAYTFVPPVSPEVEALCGRWGLKPTAPGTKLPRVFDFFIAGQ